MYPSDRRIANVALSFEVLGVDARITAARGPPATRGCARPGSHAGTGPAVVALRPIAIRFRLRGR